MLLKIHTVHPVIVTTSILIPFIFYVCLSTEEWNGYIMQKIGQTEYI